MMRVGQVNQMLLELCFCMTLHDERGGGFNQMMLALCFGPPGPVLSYNTAG